MKKGLLIFTFASISLYCLCQKSNTLIKPGEVWPDTEGNHINSHGGGIISYKGTWYWFGESRLPRTEKDRTNYGVSCYSSKDLMNWKNEGLALKVINDTASLLQPGCVIESPTGVFEEGTGEVVVWGYHEVKGHDYKGAIVVVAGSDYGTGPY